MQARKRKSPPCRGRAAKLRATFLGWLKRPRPTRRPAVSYSNECVQCGSADRAQTCPAADRQKTKPSGREAQARRGDRDPPTPTDTAERSARARGEQARRRERRHPRFWPLVSPVRPPQAAALRGASTLAKQ